MVVILDETDANVDAATGAAASVGRDGDGKPAGAGSARKGSRWNSIKHCLMAKQIFTEDLEAEIQQFTAMLSGHYVPTNPFEFRLISIMGRAGAQLDRLGKLRIADIQRGMDRATLCFAKDRSDEMDKLAARLSRDPARVARALGRTKPGAEWLIRNLTGLLRVRESSGAWDEAQYALALDLLGTRPEFRVRSGTAPTEAEVERVAALATAEVTRLEGELDHCLIALEEGAQAMAMAGFPWFEDAESKKHRKYENSARREYELAKAELLAGRPPRVAEPARGQSPGVAAAPAASRSNRRPDPRPAPDLELEPDREPDPDPSPAPRPASELLMMGSKLDTILAESGPASNACGADRSPLDIAQPVPASDAVSLAELAAVQPQKARAATNASPAAAPVKPTNRRLRRALEKAAKEAARRTGR